MDFEEVREIIDLVLRPGHFFVARSAELQWQHLAREEISWEVFRGRLLDSAQTRLRQVFDSWNVFWVDEAGPSAEPILSVKLDQEHRQLHIVRSIYCYAWEGYDSGNQVFLSREVRKWIRELVGTIDLHRFTNLDDLQDELMCVLFHAVVGSSRLPLTSVEAPLPAFSLGQLAYVHQPAVAADRSPSSPMRSFRDVIQKGVHEWLSALELTKLLETVLRQVAPEDIGAAEELFDAHWSRLGQGRKGRDLTNLYSLLFNEVALSPYTRFVESALAFLRAGVSRQHLSVEAYADFLSFLLRQVARHLTAYDLITFHHRGANYPDALLLDTALKAYLELIERTPELFTPGEYQAPEHRRQVLLRRRALRQAWMLRRFYEGLPVPDAPTSPGEAMRVLPPPHPRVPEEQILVPARRTRRLFEDLSPLELGERGRESLGRSLGDLQYPEELQELGTALFLDRPLSPTRSPGEPDQTLLVSYETFSASVALARLEFLGNLHDSPAAAADFERFRQILRDSPPVAGLALRSSNQPLRPGAVSLDDALRVAEDFRLRKASRQAMDEFVSQFDFTPLTPYFGASGPSGKRSWLIVRAVSVGRGPEGRLLLYDADFQPRLELEVDASLGYDSRVGREYPIAGLRVIRAWEATSTGELQERDLAPYGTVLARTLADCSCGE
jgi:hypothetical protein